MLRPTLSSETCRQQTRACPSSNKLRLVRFFVNGDRGLIYKKIKDGFLVVRRARAAVLGFCAREEHRSRPWISP